MNKSQRIRVDLNESNTRFVNARLEQNTKTLEILSLKIDQKDIYQNFNSDYGVLVGRVLANEGVGIPNAKVSIFIPIEDDDKDRPEIVAAYPYEKPYDKNRDEKRYNLLPRVAQEEPDTGAFKPKQPFGSFPTKEEVVTNETWLEVYDKYYKYSTKTNDAGDYMLFGVPVGVQTVHMSVDITDIGRYSMTPIDMVTQLGYSENLFTSTGEIKPQRDLEDLPHIETQEISVDVVPFWGDTENFDIGITRQDFRIRAQLINNFVIFGSYFTQGRLSVNGDPDRSSRSRNGWDDGFYRLSDDYWNNVDFRTNRVGDMTVKLYSYLQNIDMDVVDDDITNSGTTINPQTDIILVDPSSYFTYIDSENGQFILSVPCNRRKVVTDEFGNEIVVNDDNNLGIFTEFHGFAIVEFEDLAIEKTYEWDWRKPNSPNNARLRFKIPQDFDSLRDEANPQLSDYPDAFWASTVAEQIKESNRWRKKYFTFRGGNFYSVSQFFPTKYTTSDNNPDRDGNSRVNEMVASNNDYYSRSIGMFKVGGTVRTTQEDLDNTNIISGGSSGGTITGTTFVYDFPHNAVDNFNDNDLYFGAQWLNMSMYFPQINWTFDYITANDNREQNTGDVWWKDFFKGQGGRRGEWFSVGGSKTQFSVASEIDTTFMASAHGLRTDFVEVPKDDIVLFSNIDRKGLRKNDENLSGFTLSGNYKYLPPTGTSAQFNYGDIASDSNYIGSANPYFFKGMYNADAINLLFEFNFI
jgi:hypothetical protein